jgi:hypothetical protein
MFLLRLLALITVISMATAGIHAAVKHVKLDTRGGIAKPGSTCTAKYTPGWVSPVSIFTRTTVDCSNGTKYADVAVRLVAATATPAYLDYENFIGSYNLSKGNMPGGGKKLNFFNGEPRERKTTTVSPPATSTGPGGSAYTAESR